MAMRGRDGTLATMSKRPATYADLEALPANQVGEIFGGVLYAFPRPAFPHARAASRLGVDLGGPFDRGRGGPGGWVILNEPELHLGDDVLVPDLAGWRRGRMPEMPATAFTTLAPDWLCEVLSPSTTRAPGAVGSLRLRAPSRVPASRCLARCGSRCSRRRSAASSSRGPSCRSRPSRGRAGGCLSRG